MQTFFGKRKKRHTRGERGLSISGDEWLIIGSITILATILIALLPIMMSSVWFGTLIPPFQYFFYNIGFILLTIVLLGVPLSRAQEHVINLFGMLRHGVSSWLIFSFILDVWQPPLSYGTDGNALYSSPESLYGTSVDYMLGWSYQKLFDPSTVIHMPFVGPVSIIFIFVYFCTPIFAVILSALLLKPGYLAKSFDMK